MNKHVNAISDRLSLRPPQRVSLEILLEIIKRTLESGEDVMISGFGKFCVKEKKRRRGRNSATGEDMKVGVGAGANQKSPEISQMTRSDISVLDMIYGKACPVSEQDGGIFSSAAANDKTI